MKFTVDYQDPESPARVGRIETAHGTLQTPAFMPVGTRGAVKTLTVPQLEGLGAEIILGNTYHLLLRPGMEIMDAAGGLHRFKGWERAILTDSGGFQVFSLAGLNKITDEGVYFRSHIDGGKHFLGPIESMQVQKTIGADIVMCFDECTPFPCTREGVERAVERTSRWAKQCRDFDLQGHQNLFGIIQGGIYRDLRDQSIAELTALDFEGYAIGGVSSGEKADSLYEVIDWVKPQVPKEKPLYLMGVGTPQDIVEAVMRGVDMFDCVMPTRNARNGTAFTWEGKLQLKAARYAKDFTPLDPELDGEASKHSKAYVRHLLNVGEVTGMTLLTLQNLGFYLDLMRRIRQAIKEGTLQKLYERISAM